MNLKHILWTALTITMLVLTAAFLRPGTSVVMAEANREGWERKVGLCHRTGSETNPFVFIVVDENGLNGHDDHSRDYLASEEEIKKKKCKVTTTTCTTKTETVTKVVTAPATITTVTTVVTTTATKYVTQTVTITKATTTY